MEIAKIKTDCKIYYKHTTDSTNNDALKAENAVNGTVFIAEHQSAGKGRLGRNWISGDGEGIWMSILLYPELDEKDIPCITPAAGLAVCTVLIKMGYDAKIKWPNDIVISSKKVCGILSEKKGGRVVVGIGVNVNKADFENEIADKATSLFCESGKTMSCEPIIEAIIKEFNNCYNTLLKSGFAALRNSYEKHCVTVGKDILITEPCSEYEARAVAIGKSGELIIEKNGEKKAICSGEVSVRGFYGYA